MANKSKYKSIKKNPDYIKDIIKQIDIDIQLNI